jgi:tRNA/rRNA methyltransferase/tRNA (cytidine32/uridine32-2'-O)-methyltransferase
VPALDTALPVRVVLLRPHDAENLGASARALKNFGLTDWVWVDPAVDDLERARRVAVHSADLLASARVADSLDAAVSDCVWVVGTTSRRVPGRRRINPRQAAEQLVNRGAGGTVAVVFGDERNGMTNAELLRCNALSAAPTSTQQPSINLAQAVLLYAYELRLAFLSTVAIDRTTAATHREANAPKPIAATDADLRQLESLLRTVLERSRFLVDPERHAIRDLLAPLQRGALSRKEAQLWQAALHSLRRAQS